MINIKPMCYKYLIFGHLIFLCISFDYGGKYLLICTLDKVNNSKSKLNRAFSWKASHNMINKTC